MKNAVYWIALQDILGYGSNKIVEVLENFEDVSALFDKSTSFDKLRFLGEKNLKKFKSYNLKNAESVIEYCERKNIQIVTIDDEKYPIILKRIKNPPAVLYVRGTFPDFDDEVGIGMVGTRNASLNGMIAAATLSYRIAQAGGLVISGGANGIDTKCTQGALYAKKPSVIVRPCGLDFNYLNNLYDIRKQVENNGAVISEVQPLGRVERDAFQIRNRIIAALSLGIVAIEVPAKSGVLITVGHALEFGKDVFAIPGDIGDENYMGSNKLLQEGAFPVYSASDVLNEYLFAFPHKLKLDKASIPINEDDIYLRLQKKYSKKTDVSKINDKKKDKKSIISVVKNKLTKETKKEDIIKPTQKIIPKELPFEADENTKKVFDCILKGPVSLENIVEKSKLNASDVMFALTELEINGVINTLPGGRYEIR